jgi:protein-tyrosine phosphatase
MGNICRSPTAHGVFRNYIKAANLTNVIEVDSAGTHAYHVGEPPDLRSQAHARQRGYELSDLTARQIQTSDFSHYELLLVMDWDNHALTEQMCPKEYRHKIKRLTEFCKIQQATVVPDPYYKGEEGFEEVLDLVEDACEGLIDHIQTILRSAN